MNLNNTQNKSQDMQGTPDVTSVVLIKPTVKRFITGEQIFYTVVSEQGDHLAVFDTIKACKHFAVRNEYRYEFVN